MISLRKSYLWSTCLGLFIHNFQPIFFNSRKFIGTIDVARGVNSDSRFIIHYTRLQINNISITPQFSYDSELLVLTLRFSPNDNTAIFSLSWISSRGGEISYNLILTQQYKEKHLTISFLHNNTS